MKRIVEIENDYENCSHLYCTYEEWDTGYKEFGCKLTGYSCMEACPLEFKYEVIEDNTK